MILLFAVFVLLIVIEAVELEKIDDDNNKIFNCNCKTDRHTSYNEIAFTFNLNKYKILSVYQFGLYRY